MKGSTIDNPESTSHLPSHALYNNQKQARKQIQCQREQAQHTLSFLERQAKKTAKQLENKQRSLLTYYQKKESRFIDTQKKDSVRMKREQQLEHLRKTNTELREQSASKRSFMRENWHTFNRRSASSIKNSRIESEKKIISEKQLERDLLKKRNTAFSKALELGTQHSKMKARVQKRSQSSSVNSDLIYVQQSIKNRDIKKISTLTSKQKELLGIVEKNKKQRQHYDETLKQFQTLPFEQIYPSIRNDARRTKSRRSSVRSESLMVI